MAKKRALRKKMPAIAVTAQRAARLYRLVTLLAGGPQTRDAIRKSLRVDVRGFYRDLGLLRQSGIHVPLRDGHYALNMAPTTAYARLPFPDPHLNLGEARQLAQGNSAPHRKLKKLIAQVVATRKR
jgi:hypothetical protein